MTPTTPLPQIQSLMQLKKTDKGRVCMAGQLFEFARRERVYLQGKGGDAGVEFFYGQTFNCYLTPHLCDVAVEAMTRMRTESNGKLEKKVLTERMNEFKKVKKEYEKDHGLTNLSNGV